MYYDVPSWGNLRNILAKDLTDATADSIANHRASQRLFDADAQSALRPAIGTIENHETRRGLPAATPIHCLKFGAAYQTRGARKTLRRTPGSFKWA
jgi:hypothetical protein